jgi:LacI family transcriptional regulator, galactose operon repressor
MSDRASASAVTMQQVADSLGVSLSTVSLAFRDSSAVAPATRERVRTEAARLGYVYHRAAANLRRSRSNLVGLVVPTITNPFVAEMATGVQRAIAGTDFVLLLANTADDLTQQRGVIRTLAEQRAAGAIIIPVLDTPAADLRPPTAGNTPFVLVNRTVAGLRLPSVRANDTAIAALAADHLLTVHGAGTIAYFGGVAAAGPRRRRLHHLRRLAAAAGADFVDAWSAAVAPNPAAAYTAAHTLLRAGRPPEALVCHSDELAWSLLRALQERHIPPTACRVIGIDGLATSALFTPSLTTVSVDAATQGHRAGTLLLNQFGTTARPSRLTPPTLVVRESCGCPPPTDSRS